MSDLRLLQITPDSPQGGLSPQQDRFNALVRDVAAWRATLAEWQQRVERCDLTLEPIRRQIITALQQWVSALDAASLHPGMTRAERGELEALIRGANAELRDADDAEPAEDTPAAAHEVQTAPTTEDDEEPWRQAAEAAAADRERRAAARRAESKRKRHAAQSQEVSQSLRDVYRKLASALHPDREPDAGERERKTALMQHANQAYAAGNLLALLEMQLQAEQIDAAHLAALDQRRLDHYLTVLQEQLVELQRECRKLEAGFRAAVGAPPGSGMPARKADRMISAEAQRMRADLDLLGRQTRLLADPDATKDWLRAVRQSS